MAVRRTATSAREICGCTSFRFRERLNEKLKSTASERINSISRLTTWYSTNARFSAEFSSRPRFLLSILRSIIRGMNGWTASQTVRWRRLANTRTSGGNKVHDLIKRVRYRVTSIYSLYPTTYPMDICISSELSLSTFDHNNYLRIFHQK